MAGDGEPVEGPGEPDPEPPCAGAPASPRTRVLTPAPAATTDARPGAGSLGNVPRRHVGEARHESRTWNDSLPANVGDRAQIRGVRARGRGTGSPLGGRTDFVTRERRRLHSIVNVPNATGLFISVAHFMLCDYHRNKSLRTKSLCLDLRDGDAGGLRQ